MKTLLNFGESSNNYPLKSERCIKYGMYNTVFQPNEGVYSKAAET